LILDADTCVKNILRSKIVRQRAAFCGWLRIKLETMGCGLISAATERNRQAQTRSCNAKTRSDQTSYRIQYLKCIGKSIGIGIDICDNFQKVSPTALMYNGIKY